MLPENVLLALGLSRIDAWLRKKIEPLLGGIGYTDFILLAELDSVVGGRLRPVDLAQRLLLSPSGVTRALGPLVKLGLVERSPHERDARASYVSMTRAGREKLALALAAVERAVDEMFAASLTRTDRMALLGLFERVAY